MRRLRVLGLVFLALLNGCGGQSSVPAGIQALTTSSATLPNKQERIYVAEGGNAIDVFNLNGSSVAHITNPQMSTIRSIAVNGAGKIYAGNTGTNSVISFSRSGRQIPPTVTLGSSGSGGVFGLAAGPHGKIYVLDELAGDDASPITTYLPSGVQTTPTLDEAFGVAIAVDGTGTIYFSRVMSAMISIFDSNGNDVGSFFPFTVGGISAPAEGIAVTRDGLRIYLTNGGTGGSGEIDTFTKNGEQVAPTIQGLINPTSVAVDSNGRIFVVSTDPNPTASGGEMLTTYDSNGSQTTPIIKGLSYPAFVAVH